jgi:hypothetical protein
LGELASGVGVVSKSEPVRYAAEAARVLAVPNRTINMTTGHGAAEAAEPEEALERQTNLALRGTLGQGWYEPEEAGVWSGEDGGEVALELPESDTAAGQERTPFVKLLIACKVFRNSELKPINVVVLSDDREIARTSFGAETLKIIPASIQVKPGAEGRAIRFRIKSLSSRMPAETGLSDDLRKFGVWLTGITLVAAKSHDGRLPQGAVLGTFQVSPLTPRVRRLSD